MVLNSKLKNEKRCFLFQVFFALAMQIKYAPVAFKKQTHLKRYNMHAGNLRTGIKKQGKFELFSRTMAISRNILPTNILVMICSENILLVSEKWEGKDGFE